jgi:hypothetical protein
MQKLKGLSSGQNNKSCRIIHHESNKIGFTFFRFFCDFLRNLQVSAERSILLKIHSYTGAPRNFKSATDLPLLRRWTPGKFWGLAIGSSGAGRRRSGQNPASRRPCPAGRGRGKVLRALMARFSGLLGTEAPPDGAVGGARRRPPLEPLVRRGCTSGGARGSPGGWSGGPGWW